MIRKMHSPSSRQTAFLVVLLFSAIFAREGWCDSIWREGEKPDQATMMKHGWYNSVDEDLLSGGAWLSNFGDAEGIATYHLQIPQSGNYAIWIRANPTGSRLSWKMDDSPWQEAPMQQAKHRVNVAKDGAVDIRHVGWLQLAERKLGSGRHTLQLKFHSPNKNHGAIDAIFLNNEGFVPIGKGNPAIEGQKYEDGYFAWSPGRDPLDGRSPIDLSYLNEELAGQNGFVRRDGDRFVLGNGRPVRFWMVQGGLGDNAKEYERRARRLAKYGVNAVRMGGGHLFRNWRNDRPAFEKQLDDFHRKVAALKQQGIYTYIDHLYWHTHHEIDESVFPGFGDGKNAIALIFFSERFQNLYLDFLRDLMTADNPYTGRSMAKDPGVAFVEIHNESSLLFYTFKPDNFPEPELKLVEEKFGDWLIDRYGSLDAAFEAWGERPTAGKPTDDHLNDGRVGLYEAGKLTGADWAQKQRNHQRAKDQLQFMVESQKQFYEMMTHQMREAIGMGQVIAPSNWKTADARVLDALERYSYTGAEVICRNSYFGVDYQPGGQQKFYAIELGDTYRDHSALKMPKIPAPLGTPFVADYPFMVTENNWTRPNRYRVEWPWLVATYAQMAGADGWTFFAKSNVDWRHSMGVWDVSNPSILGQFPAAALVFRRGDVRQADRPAVEEVVSLDEAYAMKGTQAVPLRGEDALWKSRLGDLEGASQDTLPAVNPLAYFIGPVVQRFEDGRSQVQSVDLKNYIDTERQIVRSMTGELFWDAGRGVMVVNTPRAQGIWGFLGDVGTVNLKDVSIQSDNAYGSVVAVSLDEKPLATSERILIQTGSWDHPYGFETEPDGEYRKITKLGGYPLNVKSIEASIRFRRGDLKTATVLDGNGYPDGRNVELTERDGTSSMELPKDAIYTIVQ